MYNLILFVICCFLCTQNFYPSSQEKQKEFSECLDVFFETFKETDLSLKVSSSENYETFAEADVHEWFYNLAKLGIELEKSCPRIMWNALSFQEKEDVWDTICDVQDAINLNGVTLDDFFKTWYWNEIVDTPYYKEGEIRKKKKTIIKQNRKDRAEQIIKFIKQCIVFDEDFAEEKQEEANDFIISALLNFRGVNLSNLDLSQCALSLLFGKFLLYQYTVRESVYQYSMREHIAELNLSHCKLETLPKNFWELFPGLTNLDVSHNNLTFIPSWNPCEENPNSYSKLQIFNASCNQLKEVPQFLIDPSCLSQCHHINISNNNIDELILPLCFLSFTYDYLHNTREIAYLKTQINLLIKKDRKRLERLEKRKTLQVENPLQLIKKFTAEISVFDVSGNQLAKVNNNVLVPMQFGEFKVGNSNINVLSLLKLLNSEKIIAINTLDFSGIKCNHITSFDGIPRTREINTLVITPDDILQNERDMVAVLQKVVFDDLTLDSTEWRDYGSEITKSIPEMAFKDLETVDQSTYNLKDIQLFNTWFTSLNPWQLTRFSLQDFPLEEKDIRKIGALHRLISLTLKNCEITDEILSALDISWLSKLRCLDLSGNALEHIKIVLPRSILKMNFSKNKVKTIELLRLFAQKLSYLDLSDNKISDFQEIKRIFKNFPLLRKVNLDKNRIAIDEIENVVTRTSSDRCPRNTVTIATRYGLKKRYVALILADEDRKNVVTSDGKFNRFDQNSKFEQYMPVVLLRDQTIAIEQ
jgi:hypothetical protein